MKYIELATAVAVAAGGAWLAALHKAVLLSGAASTGNGAARRNCNVGVVYNRPNSTAC